MIGSRHQTVENALVIPPGKGSGLMPAGTPAGVLTQAGDVVRSSLLYRHYEALRFTPGHTSAKRQQDRKPFAFTHPPQPCDPADTIEGPAIFAGYYFRHFGHFLLESLSRLWFFRAKPETPIVFVSAHRDSDPELTAWQVRCLALLGVRNPVLFVRKPTRVKHLIVPEAGYLIQSAMTEAQATALQVVQGQTVTPGKKVWLSRSRQTGGRFLNEEHLEAVLRARGWDIYTAEEHDLEAQLTHLADAERIAGVAGSAFHLLALIKNCRSRVDLFVRGRLLSQNFTTIARLGGFEQHAHYCPCVYMDDGQPGWQSNYVWLSLDPVLAALGEGLSRVPSAPRPAGLDTCLNEAGQKALYVGEDAVSGHGRLVQVTSRRMHRVGAGLPALDLDWQTTFQTRLTAGMSFNLIVLDAPLNPATLASFLIYAGRHMAQGGRFEILDQAGAEQTLRACPIVDRVEKFDRGGRIYWSASSHW